MKILVTIVFILSTVGCSTSDSITALAKRLNNDIGGEWINGEYPCINLPEQANTTDVLDEAVKIVGFDEGHIKKYEIVTTRRVNLNDGNNHEYLAVLINSDLGRKIVLMRYESPAIGWWSRFYNVQK